MSGRSGSAGIAISSPPVVRVRAGRRHCACAGPQAKRGGGLSPAREPGGALQRYANRVSPGPREGKIYLVEMARSRSRPPDRENEQMAVVISAPASADADEFIAASRASRPGMHPWVDPADTAARFAAYLDRSAREDFACFLVRHSECGGLVGFVN